MLFQQGRGFLVNVEHCRSVQNFHAVQRQPVFLGTGTNFLLVPHQRHSHTQFLHRPCTAANHLQRGVVPAECVD